MADKKQNPMNVGVAPVPEPIDFEAQEARVRALEASQRVAFDRTPEKAAKVLGYARNLGIDFDAAEKSMPERPPADWGRLVKDHPVLAEALTDPGFAATAQDDVKQLSLFERLFAGWGDAVDVQRVQHDAARMWELAVIGNAEADGVATPEQLKRREQLWAEEAKAPQKRQGLASEAFGGALDQIPMMLRSTRRMREGAFTGALAGALTSPALGPAASVPALGGAIAGAGLGLTIGMVEDTAFIERGLSMNEYRQLGADVKEAGVASTFVGAVNGTLEVLPAHKVFNLIPGLEAAVKRFGAKDLMRRVFRNPTAKAAFARWAGRVAEGGIIEGVTEGAQEWSVILGSIAAGAADEIPANAWARVLESVRAGGLVGSVFGGTSATLKLRGDLGEVEQAKNRTSLYMTLGQLVQDSKLRERMPPEFKQYANRILTEYGKVDEAKAPAEKLRELFQKEGIEPAEIEKTMPSIARQLAEAQPADEIVIPMADLATHIAPLEGFKTLHQDLRIAEEPTPREAEQILKDIEKEIANDPEGPKGEEEAPAEKGARAVYDDVFKQLTERVGHAPEVAAKEALIWATFAQARASRRGMDAFDYYKKRAVQLGAEFEAVEGEKVLGQQIEPLEYSPGATPIPGPTSHEYGYVILSREELREASEGRGLGAGIGLRDVGQVNLLDDDANEVRNNGSMPVLVRVPQTDMEADGHGGWSAHSPISMDRIEVLVPGDMSNPDLGATGRWAPMFVEKKSIKMADTRKFYSAVRRAVEVAKVNKDNKATPAEWLQKIKSTPGVKADEMALLALERMGPQVTGEKRMHRDEVLSWIDGHSISVTEKPLGEDADPPKLEETPTVARLRELLLEVGYDSRNVERYLTGLQNGMNEPAAVPEGLGGLAVAVRDRKELEAEKLAEFAAPPKPPSERMEDHERDELIDSLRDDYGISTRLRHGTAYFTYYGRVDEESTDIDNILHYAYNESGYIGRRTYDTLNDLQAQMYDRYNNPENYASDLEYDFERDYFNDLVRSNGRPTAKGQVRIAEIDERLEEIEKEMEAPESGSLFSFNPAESRRADLREEIARLEYEKEIIENGLPGASPDVDAIEQLAEEFRNAAQDAYIEVTVDSDGEPHFSGTISVESEIDDIDEIEEQISNSEGRHSAEQAREMMDRLKKDAEQENDPDLAELPEPPPPGEATKVGFEGYALHKGSGSKNGISFDVKNYRELLFAYPATRGEPEYREPHYGPGGMRPRGERFFGHARFAEHLINGEKVFFIDEIQLQGHQDARDALGKIKAKIKGRQEAIEKLRRPGGYQKRVEYQRQRGFAEDTLEEYNASIEETIKESEAEIEKLQRLASLGGYDTAAAIAARVRVGDGRRGGGDKVEVTDPITDKKVTIRALQGEKLEEIVAKAAKQLMEQEIREEIAVPDMPFKGEAGPEMVLKRLLMWAAEHGYEKIAWTTGEMQIKRYVDALTEHVKKVTWKAREIDGTMRYNVEFLNSSGSRIEEVRDKQVSSPEGDAPAADAPIEEQEEYFSYTYDKLWGVIGKEGAQQIVDTTVAEQTKKAKRQEAGELTEEEQVADIKAELAGNNILVGGEGMRFFYDKKLPSMIEKIIKKAGGKLLGAAPHTSLRRRFDAVAPKADAGEWIAEHLSDLREREAAVRAWRDTLNEVYSARYTDTVQAAIEEVEDEIKRAVEKIESNTYSAERVAELRVDIKGWQEEKEKWTLAIESATKAGVVGFGRYDARQAATALTRTIDEFDNVDVNDPKAVFRAFYNALEGRYDTIDPGLLDDYERVTGVEIRTAFDSQQIIEDENVWFASFPEKLREQIKKEGLPLYQRNPAGTEGYRGKISFDEARTYFKITLTGNANLSTFLHESGHAFLEFLRMDAIEGDESAQKDLKILMNWLGKTDPELEFTTEEHEQFARGFEAYLRAGKAPSSMLREAFDAFKSWLTYVYRTLLSLNVDVTPEVSEVMDRMLATEEEIMAALEASKMQPMPALGMDEAAHAEYTDKYAKALAESKRQLEERAVGAVMQTVRRDRAKIQEEVEQATRTDKVWNAYEVLRTGKRLDGGEVPDEIKGKKLSAEIVKEYELGKKWIKLARVVEPGGLDPDVVAPMLLGDEATGEDLIKALVEMPSRTKHVAQETARRLADKYPEADIAKMSEEAVKALHHEAVENVLWLEHKALGKAIGRKGPRTARDVLKGVARRRAAGMTYVEMQPGRFKRAEATQAELWAKAVKAKDFEAAHAAKTQQILNFYMWQEVQAAKDRVDEIRDYLRKFEELSMRRRMGKAGSQYLEAIDKIIESIELRKVTNRTLDRRASLESFLQAMEEEGAVITVPAEIRAEAALKSYKQMTLEELETIHAAVKNIETMARLKNRIFDGRERRNFVKTATQLAEHIRANVGINFPEDKKQNPEAIDRIKDWFRRGHAERKKIEFLMREMDGGTTAGFAHELGFQPLATAEARKNAMYRKVVGELLAPMKKLTLGERRRYDRTVDFLGTKIRLRDVLSIALNMGNEGNRRKLIEGYAYRGWTEEKVLVRLGELLNEKDLDLVEHIWQKVGSLWPEIEGLMKRTTGVAPPKVQPMAFEIKGRRMTGGYYPIVYDRRRGYKAEQIAQRKTGDLWENNFMLPAVSKGFTEARTKFFAPIELSLSIVPAHLNEVIHYITHYEAVRAIDRLFNHKAVRAAITEGFGREVYNLLRPWLQAVAADGVVHEGTTTYDLIFRHLRVGTTITALGGKVTTAMMQALGFTQTLKEIGLRYTVTGLVRMVKEIELSRDPFRDVNEKSAQVRDFEKQMSRELLNDFESAMSIYADLGQLKDRVAHFSLAMIGLVQKTVNVATWYGAEAKALAEKHPRPEEYADSIVRLSQMGEGIKDKAAIQRGAETTRAFTVMYSYFSVLYNQLSEKSGRRGLYKVGDHAARWWWLVLLPVAIEGLLRNKFNEDDEPDKIAKDFGMEVAMYVTRTRPIMNLAFESIFSEREPRYAPWINTMTRGLKAAGKTTMEERELTESERKALMDALGTVGHLPTTAVRNAYLYLEAYQSGTLAEPISALLFQSPSQWKKE